MDAYYGSWWVAFVVMGSWNESRGMPRWPGSACSIAHLKLDLRIATPNSDLQFVKGLGLEDIILGTCRCHSFPCDKHLVGESFKWVAPGCQELPSSMINYTCWNLWFNHALGDMGCSKGLNQRLLSAHVLVGHGHAIGVGSLQLTFKETCENRHMTTIS